MRPQTWRLKRNQCICNLSVLASCQTTDVFLCYYVTSGVELLCFNVITTRWEHIKEALHSTTTAIQDSLQHKPWKRWISSTSVALLDTCRSIVRMQHITRSVIPWDLSWTRVWELVVTSGIWGKRTYYTHRKWLKTLLLDLQNWFTKTEPNWGD